jgi:hypothetical protein
MRKFYAQSADWETFSSSASLKQNEVEMESHANSPRAVIGEIGIVLVGALGLAAAIDIMLTFLQVRPFV